MEPKHIINGEDEKKGSFNRYIFDDILNCYYDPVSNEYFQEV